MTYPSRYGSKVDEVLASPLPVVPEPEPEPIPAPVFQSIYGPQPGDEDLNRQGFPRYHSWLEVIVLAVVAIGLGSLAALMVSNGGGAGNPAAGIILGVPAIICGGFAIEWSFRTSKNPWTRRRVGDGARAVGLTGWAATRAISTVTTADRRDLGSLVGTGVVTGAAAVAWKVYADGEAERKAHEASGAPAPSAIEALSRKPFPAGEAERRARLASSDA